MTKAWPDVAEKAEDGFSIRLFIAGFFLLAFIFTILMKFVLLISARADTDVRAAQLAARVETASAILHDQLSGAVSDLMVLANSNEVQALAANNSATQRQIVTAIFHTFTEQKRLYDQIRFIDGQGMEIVRVNYYNGFAIDVTDSALQNKSQCYYFHEASGLAPGKTYISPLDLNIEEGLIEQPYKPMIRLATPVGEGKQRGLMVLNMYGQPLIDRFRDIVSTAARPMLMNDSGDWLLGPSPEKDWGFMFGERVQAGNLWPEMWQRARQEEKGTLRNKAGLFAFYTIHVPATGNRGENWKALAFLSAEELPSAGLMATRIRTFVYLAGMLFLLLMSVYLTGVVSARQRLNRRITEHDLRYQEVMATLGEGVLVIDQNGRLMDMNPEAEYLLGWSRDELIGQDAHDLIHYHPFSGSVPAEECRIRQVAVTGKSYRSEDERFTRKSGQTFRVGVNAAALTRGTEVIGTVLAFRDITELKIQQEEIHHLAYHDTLTGLPNRRLLLDRLEVALAHALRHNRLMAVMFLDLDHFKEVNDTLGHDTGDALLNAVASQLRWAMREEDTVARQGGDEFIILLPDLESHEGAEHLAGRIVEMLEKPQIVGGHRLQISASIGIAFCPQDGVTLDALLSAADRAMYQAKEAGRNRYSLAESSNG